MKRTIGCKVDSCISRGIMYICNQSLNGMPDCIFSRCHPRIISFSSLDFFDEVVVGEISPVGVLDRDRKLLYCTHQGIPPIGAGF